MLGLRAYTVQLDAKLWKEPIKAEQDNIIDNGALKIVKVTEDTVCHSFDIVGPPIVRLR